MAEMTQRDELGIKRRDLCQIVMLNSKTAVVKTKAAINNFINPFSKEVPNSLTILSSGASVTPDVERDLLRAEETGRAAKEEFV